MLQRHDFPCSVAYEGKLYVFGGYKQTACECYDTVARKWTSIAAMPTQRGNARAVLMDDDIVAVMGGQIKFKPVAPVELYDINRNKWRHAKWSLPDPMYTFAAKYIDGTIYIAGGKRNHGWTSSCWSCDGLNDIGEWSALGKMPYEAWLLRIAKFLQLA